jgi:hypothetical protein
MLFLYGFGLNGKQNRWRHVHASLLDAFGHTIWEDAEICIFGKWYKFKLVTPD